MKNIDIIWFVEHISRELDVAIATSLLLQKNYSKTVKILSYNSKEILTNYSPRIVLLPYCYSIKDQELTKCLKAWPKATYINLAWEQIFYKANLEYKAPRDAFAQKYVIHHSWSNARRNFLIEKGIPRGNIFVNGHPAYALYQDPYRKVFPGKKILAQKFNLNANKKWLFFPENYSWSFYSKNNLKEIIKNGQSKDVIYTMRSYCEKAFSEVLSWLNQVILQKENDYEIILRPRPAFSLSYFNSRLKEIFPNLSPRIHIIKDFSVREWILASDIVVSSFSTSLIEAAFAQKPIFMLEPFKIPSELQAKWYELVSSIKTFEEFNQLLSQKRFDSTFKKLRKFALKEFFVNGDSIKDLVDFLAKFDPKSFFDSSENKQKENLIHSATESKLTKKIINTLGQIKRNLTDKQDYFQNDDQIKFDKELKSKTLNFGKLIKL